MSKVSFRERGQGLTIFNLSYTNIPDFNTLRDATTDCIANNVIKRLVRKAKPGEPNEMREVAIRCFTGERQVYIGGYSKHTNVYGLSQNYERTHRYNIATGESDCMEIVATC